MENIINKACEYKYNSLEYVDAEDISNAKIYINTDENIFLYQKANMKKEVYWNSKSINNIQIFWASKSRDSFFQGLHNTIDDIKQNEKETEKIYMEFIPKDFLVEMKSIGFKVVSEWVDYWSADLKALDLKLKKSINIRPIKDDEVNAVVNITRSCTGYSRGFTGQSEELIKEWSHAENSCLFAAELNGEIVGICYTKLYGFESEKGTILWIRELAVNPKYHSKGIGHELLTYAVMWGIEKGAKRSFLACDAENAIAIKLYESFNYRRKSEPGQINVECVIK